MHRPGDHPLGMAGHDEELLLVLGESLLIDSHELGQRQRLAEGEFQGTSFKESNRARLAKCNTKKNPAGAGFSQVGLVGG